MAKFKCKNCGHVFETFCDSALDATRIQCNRCASHWVERVGDSQSSVFPFTNLISNKYKFAWGEKPIVIIRNSEQDELNFGKEWDVLR